MSTAPAPKGPPAKDGPKQERARRTRREVLASAAEAFADHGFPPVTVVDIANLAGVTKGAVYFHFANKEALAQAIAGEFYAQLGGIADSVVAEGHAPLEVGAQLLLRTAEAFRDDKIVQAGARLQLERNSIGIDMPVPFVRYHRLMASALSRAQEIGDLGADVDPESLARVLISAFFGAQHISWVLEERSDIVERTEEIIRSVIPQIAQS